MNGAFRPKGGNGVHGLCDDAGGGKISDFAGGVIPSSRRDTTTAPNGSDFICPSGRFHFAVGKISPAHRADFTEGGFCRPHAL